MVTRCLLATLALATVVAVPAAAVVSVPGPQSRPADDGAIGLRLVDIPAVAHDDPRARLYIVDHLPPGTVVHRRIEVTNTTGSTVRVELYPAAATLTDGSFVGSAGRTPNDLSMWTSVRPTAPEVLAGGLATATVTIAVPRDAPPGEQYGVVWAEVRSASAGGGVVQVNRVGIRLYVSVGLGGPPAADFTIDSLTAQRAVDGRPMVLVSVHNTGGRALDMEGTLQLLAGPGGLTAGPFPVVVGTTLAIGETESVQVALDERLPAGPWEARITLRSGLLERTAQAAITFPDSGTSPPVDTSPTRPGWLYPAGIGLLLLSIAAALLVAYRRAGPRRLHRRGHRQAAPTP